MSHCCNFPHTRFPAYVLVKNVESIVRVPNELSLEVAALLPGGAALAYAAVKRARLLVQHKLSLANAGTVERRVIACIFLGEVENLA